MGGVVGAGQRQGGGGDEDGRVGLVVLASIGPAVDSQLLRHHNKQRPHKGPAGGAEQPEWDTAPRLLPKEAPVINFYTVATETELSLLGSD